MEPVMIKTIRILRRSGVCTINSDSVVVNPVPLRADMACRRAIYRGIPVCSRNTPATRTIVLEIANNTTMETAAPILPLK